MRSDILRILQEQVNLADHAEGTISNESHNLTAWFTKQKADIVTNCKRRVLLPYTPDVYCNGGRLTALWANVHPLPLLMQRVLQPAWFSFSLLQREYMQVQCSFHTWSLNSCRLWTLMNAAKACNLWQRVPVKLQISMDSRGHATDRHWPQWECNPLLMFSHFLLLLSMLSRGSSTPYTLQPSAQVTTIFSIMIGCLGHYE